MVHSSQALPPLDTLEAFSAAVRTGSFSSAATELGLTHGAVSRQVSRLERWMGVKLFDRAARGVALTPEGTRFHARAIEALALLGDTTERWAPGRGRPIVRLSTIPSLTALWLFPRLAALEGGDFHIELVLENRLADFAEGVDLAIRCGRGPWAGVRGLSLWPERVMPIAAPALAARLPGAAMPQDILAWPLLHDSNIGGWRRWLAMFGLTYAPRVQDRRFEDYHLVLEACVQGLGIALARPPLVQAMLADGRLVVVNEASCDNEVSYHLIRPEEPLRPQAKAVARRLLRAVGKEAAEIEMFVA